MKLERYTNKKQKKKRAGQYVKVTVCNGGGDVEVSSCNGHDWKSYVM